MLAERIEADHKQSNRELMELADKKDADFPGEIGLPGMTDAQKAERDRLPQARGPAFDKAWVDHMVTEHQRTIELYTQGARCHGYGRQGVRANARCRCLACASRPKRRRLTGQYQVTLVKQRS